MLRVMCRALGLHWVLTASLPCSRHPHCWLMCLMLMRNLASRSQGCWLEPSSQAPKQEGI